MLLLLIAGAGVQAPILTPTLTPVACDTLVATAASGDALVATAASTDSLSLTPAS